MPLPPVIVPTENVDSRLPNPFQDDEEQLDVDEEDENSGQDFLSKYSSGINKPNNIKLKEPWHTLAIAAFSLFYGQSVFLPSIESCLEEPDLDRRKLYALVMGHLVSTQGDVDEKEV
ncbi:hypothetical protein BGZ99_001388 [Dissophora globulifera]|uniref:Uncharacterized protein n=1 Tax=Dissophora globulifera TaxID=979702 RepID=A0A9P6UK52_9FUNG|nr:hypothetical protein BGZ99_001388 [Dissophora globulifera]